jgi:hypothetical protein
MNFWKHNRSSPKRYVKLGIDYGTSSSKVVFRDCSPSSKLNSWLIVEDGSAQIASRICVSPTAFLFGQASVPAMACDSCESLKSRIAAEATGNPAYQLGRTARIPDGFTAADLAALTVWFLISKGHQAVAAHFKEGMESIELGATMGVPIEFLNHQGLKSVFLGIARRAWSLYCDEGLVDAELSIDRARRVLETHPVATHALSEEQIREWIRNEGEAGLWVVLRSPSVAVGPYATVNIGAGTTHASLFRIFGKLHTIKRSLAPFGTGAVPVGMDRVDLAIAECGELSRDYSTLRGSESALLRANQKIQDAVRVVCNQIYDSYRKAWNEAYTKLSSNSLEQLAWRQHKMIVLGGGSLVPFLVDAIGRHPADQQLLPVLRLEQPEDLSRADGKNVTSDDLQLASVAYGLSMKEFHVPNPYARDSV